jgi:MFS family permease
VEDIGGDKTYTWLAIVYSLAFAAVAPFTGALSDQIGRRYLGMVGPALIIVGMAVLAKARTMPVGIGGMAIAGAGGGISQVIGISGVCEIVPAKYRGRFIGTIYLLFSPMAPAPAYGAQFSCHR